MGSVFFFFFLEARTLIVEDHDFLLFLAEPSCLSRCSKSFSSVHLVRSVLHIKALFVGVGRLLLGDVQRDGSFLQLLLLCLKWCKIHMESGVSGSQIIEYFYRV